MGTPCNEVDMNLFYNATAISIGNGKIAPFWDLPWLNGAKPKDIAPLIFEASKSKSCKVAQALHNNVWIAKVKMDTSLTVDHIREYLKLWVLLHEVHLQEDINDAIS
jgi:hypothetical protein